MHFKRYLKRSLCIAFKKNRLNCFFDTRPKIALLNLGMHQFAYSEQLIHMKRHLKRSLFIEFKENPSSHFSLRESLPKPKFGYLFLINKSCFTLTETF